MHPALISNDTDLLAVATLQGRLLIFPVLELPALVKGKGNKLIQIPVKDFQTDTDKVISTAIIAQDGFLRVISGKRHLTLKVIDIEHYSGNRAKRGLALPRGFRRVDEIVAE